MKVQEYYFTLACLFMDRIWMYLVCHQLFKQPTLKVVNKTEFHAHSYAECRGGGILNTRPGKDVPPSG